MKPIQYLLIPFAFAYGIIVWIRNKLFDLNVFPSHNFDIPIISIGNLSAGGTGKTPMIEYLIRLLHPKYHVATLSRGYGRNTKGLMEVTTMSTAIEVGDEPLQFKRKFKDVNIFVDESRMRGIRNINLRLPETQIILLDDAFQHRWVKPGLNIILTDYNNLYFNDHLLPVGTLRESKEGAHRADAIIVTKTPENLTAIERKTILKDIKPRAYQKVFFTYIKYKTLIPLYTSNTGSILDLEYYIDHGYTLLIIAGIANNKPLIDFLRSQKAKFEVTEFSDHHAYTPNEIKNIRSQFENLKKDKCIVVTTEKDAMRLSTEGAKEILQSIPVFYLPIETAFHQNDAEEFNLYINEFVHRNL